MLKKNNVNQCSVSVKCAVGRNLLLLLFLMMETMAFPSTSFAYTSCVGGTIITRNQNGSAPEGVTCTAITCPVSSSPKTFCKSTNTMNWWTAFNWCRSNGGTLASFNSMCPGVEAVNKNTEGACPALQKTASNWWVWSSLESGESNAFVINLSSGAVFNNEARYRDYRYAFCE